MKHLSLRHLLIGLSMIASAALAAHFTPTKTIEADSAPDFHKVVPKQFGDWKQDTAIVPVLPTPSEQTLINTIYSQFVSRTYVNGKGQRMMVVIAFGNNQNNELKVHRQEVCYAAQGYKIEHLTHRKLDVGGARIPLTEMFAVNGSRHEAVTYWLTIGNHVVLSRLGRLLTEIKYSATGQIPSGMLVRISSLGPYRAADSQAHIQFADELLRGIAPRDRHWFVGASNSRKDGQRVPAGSAQIDR